MAATLPSKSTHAPAVEVTTGSLHGTLRYIIRKRTGEKPKATLLLLHGGCFVEGDETYNADQALGLVHDLHVQVVTCNFAQTNFNDTMSDIRVMIDFCRGLDEPNIPVGVIGCSSGGYFALCLALDATVSLNMVIAVCPVALPKARLAYLLSEDCSLDQSTRAKMIRMQNAYWSDSHSMDDADARILDAKHVWCVKPICIFGNHDKNVPDSVSQLFLNACKTHANRHVQIRVLDGGHELCFKPFPTVNAVIEAALHA